LLSAQKVLAELLLLLEANRILFLQEPWKLAAVPQLPLLPAQALMRLVLAAMVVVPVAMALTQLLVVAVGAGVAAQVVILGKEVTPNITAVRDIKMVLEAAVDLDFLPAAA
jgi:hypothetical protein